MTINNNSKRGSRQNYIQSLTGPQLVSVSGSTIINHEKFPTLVLSSGLKLNTNLKNRYHTLSVDIEPEPEETKNQFSKFPSAGTKRKLFQENHWNVVAGGYISNAAYTAQNGGSNFSANEEDYFAFGLETGTDSNGRAWVRHGDTGCLFASGSWKLRMDVKVPTLSDGTDTFIIGPGFRDTRPGVDNKVVAFRYTDSEASGNWQAHTTDSVTDMKVDTGIPVVADTWYVLEIEVNSKEDAKFYVDGSLVASITGSIPTSTGIHPAGITKSAGTTSRSMLIRYSAWQRDFDNAI